MARRTGNRSVVRHLVGKLPEILQRVVPAHLVKENILRIGGLTGDARARLVDLVRAQRVLDILERIDMAAVVVYCREKA